LLLIVALYACAALTGAVSGQDPEILRMEGFPLLGRTFGGWWLGALISIGGMASALGLFFSTLLSVSRIPKAMADDEVLPRFIAATTSAQRVPYASLILCGLIVSGMLFWKFPDLVIIDVSLYGAALSLEFAALIVLRVRKPNAFRPFRIPLPLAGIVALALLPLLCLAVAVASLLDNEFLSLTALFFAGGALFTGPVGWWLFGRRHLAHAPPPPSDLTS